MSDLVVIDGSHGEGGGQVLRTSVALAAITGRPLEVHGIRAKRAKPGLQPQHLMAVKAAGELCEAELKGAEVGSGFLRFVPRQEVSAGEFRFDIGTAGATTLVLQTVFAPLALAGAPSRVTVTGGTHNPMAPPADYLEEVFLPAMRRMGVATSLAVPQFGFFPRGGGSVTLELSCESGLKGIVLEKRGDLKDRLARVIVSGLPEDVARRGAARLKSFLPDEGQIETVEKPSLGAGAAIFVAERYADAFGGFSGIGARGKRMESVAEDAGEPYREWLSTDATVDEHLSDQLVLPAALASGGSRWRSQRVSEHLRTVVWVVGQFLDRRITVDEGSRWVEVA